ncbi:tetratricopeptide repeat protein [Mucilaginibacter pedocola]|uniref:Outer membrane protein beta-barrel domain-containing protein n=1 Tax=Mucilaginibacter pedocola TaxID=1792845 RepID=A0A1S9P8D6_9SPHI|nr:hypothetical protein [Mucilaginibacter pedocola]OOQ57179.1 hypothetical protein BC343_16810 [Mucilaginibacter pedocola]
MGGLKYILLFTIVLSACVARAQQDSYQQTDSTSYALYLSGNWQQLINYGERAVQSGVDFPLLRLRMGYAQFIRGNYTAALDEYREVLKHDSHNQTANYYAYLCNLYLNRYDAAGYHLGKVDDSTYAAKPSAYRFISASTEHSIKYSKNPRRGNGNYTRFGISNTLGNRLVLDESVAWFGQNVYHRFLGIQRNHPIKQFEYYGKLNYAVANNLSVFGGYHYLNTQYSVGTYSNHIGLAGVKYTDGNSVLQADAHFGNISDTTFQQYNLQWSAYPTGNLNFYIISKASLLHQGGTKLVYSQTIGAKLIHNFWIEANSTIGELNNYLDADGLYVYNAIDIATFKAGGTGYYRLGEHVILYVNYTFEQRDDFYHIASYNQHSVTGGLTWKF